MKEPLDVVDEHIDTFIRIGRHRWDMGCLIFDGDPICDIEGTFKINNAEIFPSEDCFSQVGDPYIW